MCLGGLKRLTLGLTQRNRRRWGWRERTLRLCAGNRYRPEGPGSGLLTWLGVKTARYGAGSAEEDSEAWRKSQLMRLWT